MRYRNLFIGSFFFFQSLAGLSAASQIDIDRCLSFLERTAADQLFLLPPQSRRHFLGLQVEMAQTRKFFLATPYYGQHAALVNTARVLENPIGPLNQIQWGGEFTLKNNLSEPAVGKLTQWNVSSGTLFNLGILSSVDAFEVWKYQPELMSKGYRGRPFSEENRHLHPRLNPLSIELGGNVNHKIRGVMNEINMAITLAKQDVVRSGDLQPIGEFFTEQSAKQLVIYCNALYDNGVKEPWILTLKTALTKVLKKKYSTSVERAAIQEGIQKMDALMDSANNDIAVIELRPHP